MGPQRLTLEVALEEWPLSAPLRITGYTFTSLTFLVVTASDGVHFGRGEATGVFYLDEKPASLVWALAGLPVAPGPLLTTYTLGADTPEAMAEGASVRYRDARAIKLKLLGDWDDAARVRAVRTARPDVWIGVDANQGLTRDSFADLLPSLIEARVALIEQPFKSR